MLIKKVLLIDDKKSHQKGCGTTFVRDLHQDLKGYLDFRDSLDTVVQYSRESPELLINLNEYCCVLIHASYDSSLFDESKLSEIYSILNEGSPFVLFSGNSVLEGGVHTIKRTSRERLFEQLSRMLSAYSKIGFFHTPYLYDPKTKLQVPLIHDLMDILENSKKEFLNSNGLKNWLTLLGYTDSYKKVIENYTTLSQIELNEKLGDWLLKDIKW